MLNWAAIKCDECGRYKVGWRNVLCIECQIERGVKWIKPVRLCIGCDKEAEGQYHFECYNEYIQTMQHLALRLEITNTLTLLPRVDRVSNTR